jgi:hypothetical protein
MPFNINDIPNAITDVISGIGTGFRASAENSAAVAEYNSAVAEYIRSKAAAEQRQTSTITKTVNTAVVGLLVIFGIYVIAKFIVPKLK